MSVPVELRERDQWVVWRLEDRDRDGKPTKVPYRADRPTGRASSTDPATWSSYDAAVELAAIDLAGFGGIGYVFSADDPFAGADLDDCLQGTTMHPDAAEIVLRLDSFTEISPSGTGVKIIVRATKNGNKRCRTRASWGGDIEVYDRDRFWTITGNPLSGTPETIEGRQEQFETVLARLLPTPAPAVAHEPQPVDLEDQELLERAFRARNGTNFQTLWNGQWRERYPTQSEADLALCSMLAFWTGREETRIDALFRRSGLMRDKWDRDDYRTWTIGTACASTTDVFQGTRTNSERRISSELVADSGPPADAAVDYFFGASSVREEAPRRSSSGQPENFFDASDEEPNYPTIRVEEIHAFAAVEEPGAEPLLGDEEVCVLALDGTMTTYGTGGSAKTTTAVDRAAHYAAGDPWLGIPVPSSRRVLIIEDEGPRGRFRKKLKAKLATWTGSEIEDRMHVVSEPWGMLRFDNPRSLIELTAHVDALGIEVIVAGPIKRLGLQGGGTPEEVQAFLLLLEEVKQRLGRPLAYDLTHHPNKAGSVSGDWEGTGDTLVRLDKRGPRASTLTWEKVRWGGTLQGTAWKLAWKDGERFEIEEEPERTEEDIAAETLAFVAANPGTTWTPVQKKLKGTATMNAAMRDRLLAEGVLVNAGAAKQGAAMRLYLLGDAPDSEQISGAEHQQAALDLQAETGTYAHPTADVIQRAKENRDRDEFHDEAF